MHIENRLTDPDGWYEALMNAHRDLSEAQSTRLNAALVLLLANQIADMSVLRACVEAARAAALDPLQGGAKWLPRPS